MTIDECGAVGGVKIYGERKKYEEKTRSSATLCTTNPKRAGIEVEPLR
jgi:hypothetical protein